MLLTSEKPPIQSFGSSKSPSSRSTLCLSQKLHQYFLFSEPHRQHIAPIEFLCRLSYMFLFWIVCVPSSGDFSYSDKYSSELPSLFVSCCASCLLLGSRIPHSFGLKFCLRWSGCSHWLWSLSALIPLSLFSQYHSSLGFHKAAPTVFFLLQKWLSPYHFLSLLNYLFLSYSCHTVLYRFQVYNTESLFLVMALICP